MSRHIAFITDPLPQLDLNSDTVALIQNAQAHGNQVFWMESSDLHIKHGTPVGFMASITSQSGSGAPFVLGESFLANLDRFDAIFWRKASPYSPEDQFALDVLQLASSTTRIFNNPVTLRSTNEHIFALQFPNFVPQTLVTKSTKAINAFVREVGGRAFVRKLHSPASSNIMLQQGSPDLKAICGLLTDSGKHYAYAQSFIDPMNQKRLYFVNGECLGTTSVEGAQGPGITPQDGGLMNAVGAALRERGLLLATVDVADGKIVDLNLSCPEGFAKLNRFEQEDIFARIFAALG